MTYLLPDAPTLDFAAPEWQERAACAGIPDDMTWFPESKRGTEYALDEAARTCGTCPVRTACLEYAITHRLEGVWAGTTEADREKLRRRVR